jgi:ABC-type transport system involved in cytochrome bd biosynthesis fused ATPase/permease subunit
MVASVSGPLITGLAGLGGVALGGVLTMWKERQGREAQALAELHAAALHVLARVEKIQLAGRLGGEWSQTRLEEIEHLGGDLDTYLATIARIAGHTQLARWHCAIYDTAMPIVVGHDLSRLDDVVAELLKVRADLFKEQAA